MEKNHSFARSSSTASKKSKKHLRGTRSLPAELNKKNTSHHHKHVTKRVNKKESRRHNRSKNSWSATDEEYDTKSATICKNIANDLLDYALDICLTRFVHETLPESIVWDLRDTWLDIVSMQWMDSSDSILQAPKGYLDRIFKNGDELSLPPAFDNWSRGTLVEYKPRKFEELVLDPFLRDNPLPTSCNVEIEPINQAIPSINVATTTSSIDTRDDEEEVEEEKAWSTNASGGESFHNIVDVTFDGAEVLDKWNSPINARGMQSGRTRKTFNFVDKTSIELLYPAKFPSVDIKASSELSYKLKNGGTAWKEVSNGEDSEAKQLIAFKLPYQTSSESVRDHLERQARNKARIEEE